MSDRKLRNSLIKLAKEHPQFRPDLLPLLKEGGKNKAPGVPDGTGPRGGTPECPKKGDEDTAEGDEEKDSEAVEQDEGKDEGKMAADKEAAKWIQDAIKKPGRVRKYLGIPKGKDIPLGKLDGAIKKLKGKEEKTPDETSMLQALNLARRLKTEF